MQGVGSIRGALLWPSSDLSQDAGLRARISLDGFYLGPRDDTLCCSHLCGSESEEDETRPTERCGARPDAVGSVRLWAHVAGRGRRAPGLGFASPHLGSRRRARAPGIASGPASSAGLRVL